MLIRLPWLNSRKRFLLAVLIDICLFLKLYLVWFMLRFGVAPNFSYSLTVLLGFWVLSSYVLGRYYDLEDPRASAGINQLARTLLTLVLSLGLYLFCNWLSSLTLGVNDSRSLLLPFLASLGVCSGGMQFILNYTLQSRFHPAVTWKFIATTAQFEQLQQVIGWKRINAHLEHWPSDQHRLGQLIQTHVLSFNDPDFAGIVVPDFQVLSNDLKELLLCLQSDGLSVLSTIGWCEHVLQRYPPQLLSSVDLLRGEFAKPKGSIYLRIKRLGDVTVSALLLLLCMPLLLLAGLLIWLQDHGPVFYSQIRSGLGGEPYRVWKLRSMRINAEVDGAQWSGRGDQRITPIGRLLRLIRLDELPQLWLVLKGEMSLIGPRPERPEIEAELKRSIPHYRLRHLILPGITGWAQVNYPYGASLQDSQNKLSYDLYYMRNSSFLLDLLIAAKTIRLVFNAKGALAQR